MSAALAQRCALGLAVCAALGALGCASWRAARLYQSGTQALDAGEVARAVDELERAAELRPQASEVHNHLGLAYLAAARDAEAELAFRRALEFDCANEAALANLRAVEPGSRETLP